MRRRGGEADGGYGAETEGALLKRIAASDRDAFTELYDRYGSTVYSLAYAILRDPHAAEDVVQDVFISVWKGAASFDPRRGTVRTWVLSLAHHKSVDVVRRLRARGTSPLDDPVVDPADLVHDVLRELDAHRVRAALETLSPLQREAITLAYYGGCTQREIAHRLGVPLGTIKTRIRDGLLRLRALLGNQSQEERR